MSTARFRFDEQLFFLAGKFRGRAFAHDCARAATLKNAIEALGVPHTEVGAVSVNGEPATLQRIVREGDVIDIHPWTNSGSDPELRFVAASRRAMAGRRWRGRSRFACTATCRCRWWAGRTWPTGCRRRFSTASGLYALPTVRPGVLARQPFQLV